ncbi:MAG: hypothetical protein JJ693_06520 [Acidithiobacillus sp.]|nr:hypothetical protein [Acidithiobacillus sp.]
MFVDHWQSGTLSFSPDWMFSDDSIAMESQDLALLRRLDQYLGQLSLNDGQRLWLRTEVLRHWDQLPEDPAQRCARAFATLQDSVAALHRGDEWEARLALVLGPVLPADVERPSRWLSRQQRPVTRQCMASMPMDRSLRGFWRRQKRVLQGLWGRGRRLVQSLGGV